MVSFLADLKVDSKDKSDPFEKLFEVYLLYFDEEKGQVPLIVHPDESIKLDPDKMRPINIHSIWFLDIKDQTALDHVDLEYSEKTYFAKKFLAVSRRKKRRAGLVEATPETIVIILALPSDMDLFGGDLLNKIYEKIVANSGNVLYELIEAEIAKDEIIKTDKVKTSISNGILIKEEIKKIIKKAGKEYFASVIKQSDATSIKQQKAIAFLSLKGIDITHIADGEKGGFSNLKLFDPMKKSQPNFRVKGPFEISEIKIIEDSQELEILVKNYAQKELVNIDVKITHVKEFFEKEIMNQLIDVWAPDEELLFISPIIPHINEYLFFIVEESSKEKLLSKKIDLSLIQKIKS